MYKVYGLAKEHFWTDFVCADCGSREEGEEEVVEEEAFF